MTGPIRGNYRSLATLAWQGADLLLGVGLAATVLFFGGRHPWGEAVLLVTAPAVAALTLLGMLGRSAAARGSGAEILLLATTGWVLFQLWPLPTDWLPRLSPQVAKLLPAWQGGVTAEVLGRWSSLSLAPQQTRLGLGIWLAYVLLFLSTFYRTQRLGDTERYLRFFAWGSLFLAIFGLLQYLFANGRLFWFYEHPFIHTRDAVKASFTNRNHFAQFLAMSLGPLLWWLLCDPGSENRQRGRFSERWNGSSAPERQVLKWLALPTVGLALLLTFSRGGISAAVLAGIVAGIVLCWAGVIRGRWIWAGLAGLALLVGEILIVGPETISARWESVFHLRWHEIDAGWARTTVWQETWRAAQDFPLTGSGVGTFPSVHPHYRRSRSSALYYTHAENGVLQILLETGWPGIILLAWGLILLSRWGWLALVRANDPRRRTVAGAIVAGLVAFVIHGLVDYVWYVPALAALASVLAGSLARLAQMAHTAALGQTPASSRQLPATTNATREFFRLQPAGFAFAGILALSAFIELPMTVQRYKAGFAESAWHRFLIAYRQSGEGDDSQAQPDLSAAESTRTPADSPQDSEDSAGPGQETAPSPHLSSATAPGQETGADRTSTDLPAPAPAANAEHVRSASRASRQKAIDTERELIRLLEAVVRNDPARAEAHLQLAKAYLRLFHHLQEQSPNPMPLSQLRDAAMNAGFSSPSEVEGWLQRACGDHAQLLKDAYREALTACRLCPLQAEAYFILGQTSLHSLRSQDALHAWFQQCVTLRPHDGDLLFRIGAEYAMLGDYEKGISLWQAAFRSGPWYRERLLRFLVGRAPPELVDHEIAFLLDTFDPDLESLRLMYRLYRRRFPAEVLGRLQRAYETAIASELSQEGHSPKERSELWLESHFLERDAGNAVAALRSAQEAVRCDPNNYRARYYLAMSLEEAGRYAEAEEHLRWCVLRRPGHRALQKRLEAVSQKRLEAERMARAPMGQTEPARQIPQTR